MIQFQAVRKSFGNFVAVDQFDCEIPTGATVGLVGPNGAGKTTIMRMLTTLSVPTSGQILINGQVAHANPYAVRRQIGFMPDTFGVYTNITASEYLDFYAQCQHIEATRRPQLVKDLLELVDLSDKHANDVNQLSRGMAQRLSLARALIHNPDILVLDEPASGLDPNARIELKSLINELRRQGKTILVSSHILSDLADMCTHLLILQHGKVVAYDTITHLLSASKQQRIIIKVVSDTTQIGAIATAHGYTCEAHGDIAQCYVLTGSKEPAQQATLLSAFVQAGIPIYDFSHEHHSLERLFMQLITPSTSQ